MNIQTYDYVVSICGMDNEVYLAKLLRYLEEIKKKIIPDKRVKIIFNSLGGESILMKKVYFALLAIYKKGAKIDIYCFTVASAGLILLILIKNSGIANKIYGYHDSAYMWHEPTTYYEFEGVVSKKNCLLLKGSLTEVHDYLESLYLDSLAFKEEYLYWESIYIDLVTYTTPIEEIEEEIKYSIFFSAQEALRRKIIDLIIAK